MNLQAREGQRVPEVTFRCRKDNDWNDIRAHDIFAGRNVVVFALPGAFTPTCSSARTSRATTSSHPYSRRTVSTRLSACR